LATQRASVELDNVTINGKRERGFLEVDEIQVETFDGRFIRCIIQTPVMITSDENLMGMWLESHLF
jgi:hypothetical protein